MAFNNTSATQMPIKMKFRYNLMQVRTQINEEFNVQMKFPKTREFIHGEFQTMLLFGSKKNVNKVIPYIRNILYCAEEEHLVRKERKDRYYSRLREMNLPKLNSDNNKTKVEKAKKKNMFEALDGLFEQEEAEREEQKKNQIEFTPVKQKKTTMNFASALRKEPVKVVVETKTDETTKKHEVIQEEKAQEDEEFDKEFYEEESVWNEGMSWGDC